MKKFYFLFSALFITSLSDGQSILYQETFESPTANGTNYFTSIPEFTDIVASSGGDFFIRTDESNVAVFYDVSGQQGSFYFGAMDIDGEGAVLPVTLTTTPIDISSLSNFTFWILLAEDDDGTNQDWDNADYVHITYSIDGGGDQNAIWIEGDETSGSASNSTPRIDTDFDGTGDGTEITDTFSEFVVANIATGGGSSVVFKIEYNLNSVDEDLAIDNIRVADYVLGTKENQIDGFDLYPNPTSSAFVNITSDKHSPMKVSVYDILGKQVIERTVTNNRLNISNLNTGVYILRAQQDNAFTTRKLIIN